jgi:hypothetical protein
MALAVILVLEEVLVIEGPGSRTVVSTRCRGCKQQQQVGVLLSGEDPGREARPMGYLQAKHAQAGEVLAASPHEQSSC